MNALTTETKELLKALDSNLALLEETLTHLLPNIDCEACKPLVNNILAPCYAHAETCNRLLDAFQALRDHFESTDCQRLTKELP